MRTLVIIKGHRGYVDIPLGEDEQPNPYASPFPGNPRLFVLNMEIVESPAWNEGDFADMLFKRGQIEILED